MVTSIAIHFGFLLENYGRFFYTLLLETALFLSTFLFVRNFVKKIYIPLLHCQEKKVQEYLDRASFVWFLTILLLNLQFVFTDNKILTIVTLAILGLNIIYHFQLIFEVLKRDHAIGSLQEQVTKDTLTGIGNRLGFTREFEQKVKTEKSFTIIYCDLDNFKSINDSYGHNKGDFYLREFSSCLIKIIGEDCVFRISGDEFAMFVTNRKFEDISQELSKIKFENKINFIGASYGSAVYPKDGTKLRALVDVADKKMYATKQEKKLINMERL